MEKVKPIAVDTFSNVCFSIVICLYRRDLAHFPGEEEVLRLELDIGGELVLELKLTIPKNNPKIFQIDSSFKANKAGAGSGGFSMYF